MSEEFEPLPAPPPPVAADAPAEQTPPPVGPPVDDTARRVRSANACAGWAVGISLAGVLCCGGVGWVIAYAIEEQAGFAQDQLDEFREEEDRREEAQSLLESVAHRLRRGAAAELPETLLEAPPKDPWGTPVRYERESPDEAILVSAGPDRRFDTDDDVTVPVAAR